MAVKPKHKILVGDCRDQLKKIPADLVHCCVTSPPYFASSIQSVGWVCYDVG